MDSGRNVQATHLGRPQPADESPFVVAKGRWGVRQVLQMQLAVPPPQQPEPAVAPRHRGGGQGGGVRSTREKAPGLHGR